MNTCHECGSIMTLRQGQGSWHCANCGACEAAGPCKCGAPATVWWLDNGSTLEMAHGYGEPRCERCCVVDQLAHARAAAARIPELEARLKALEPPHWLDRPDAPPMRKV